FAVDRREQAALTEELAAKLDVVGPEHRLAGGAEDLVLELHHRRVIVGAERADLVARHRHLLEVSRTVPGAEWRPRYIFASFRVLASDRSASPTVLTRKRRSGWNRRSGPAAARPSRLPARAGTHVRRRAGRAASLRG